MKQLNCSVFSDSVPLSLIDFTLPAANDNIKYIVIVKNKRTDDLYSVQYAGKCFPNFFKLLSDLAVELFEKYSVLAHDIELMSINMQK